MGHNISAVILKGGYDAAIAEHYDLRGVPLGFELTMFPIDHCYTACWRALLGVHGRLGRPSRFAFALFPGDRVVAELMTRITHRAEPHFAVIATDYFGGVGSQGAAVYRGVDLASEEITTINQALKYLGVKAQKGCDDQIALARKTWMVPNSNRSNDTYSGHSRAGDASTTANRPMFFPQAAT